MRILVRILKSHKILIAIPAQSVLKSLAILKVRQTDETEPWHGLKMK